MVMVSKEWPFKDYAAGLTEVLHNVNSGRINFATVSVNEPLVGITDEGTCGGFIDLEGVLTHELGHLIGIAHPCETADTYPMDPLCPPIRCEELMASWAADEQLPTMWPSAAPCDRQLTSLEADDVAAICTIYPKSEPNRACFPLPVTGQRALVANKSFGCSTSEGSPALWVLALLPWLLGLRRRPA